MKQLSPRAGGISCACPRCGHTWIYSGRAANPAALITCPSCYTKSALNRCALYDSIEEELEGRILDLIIDLGIPATVTREEEKGEITIQLEKGEGN